MSINVKISDEDAVLVMGVLKRAAQYRKAVAAGEEAVAHLRAFDRLMDTPLKVEIIAKIAGAYEIAVRANRKG